MPAVLREKKGGVYKGVHRVLGRETAQRIAQGLLLEAIAAVAATACAS